MYDLKYRNLRRIKKPELLKTKTIKCYQRTKLLLRDIIRKENNLLMAFFAINQVRCLTNKRTFNLLVKINMILFV
jgi:hypothetical protein